MCFIQNVLGMSVVGPDFEQLKRYNIEELRGTESKPQDEPKVPIAIKEED